VKKVKSVLWYSKLHSARHVFLPFTWVKRHCCTPTKWNQIFLIFKANFDVAVMSSFYVSTTVINGEVTRLWQLVLLDSHILITLILHICCIISDFFFLSFFHWFMLLTLESLKNCGIDYYKMSMISRIWSRFTRHGIEASHLGRWFAVITMAINNPNAIAADWHIEPLIKGIPHYLD